MWALVCATALAEEPLHHLHAGAAARGVFTTDRLPTDPDLGQGALAPARVAPTLTFGNVTLWGHAEVWMRVTPWSGAPLWGFEGGWTDTQTQVRMEAGGRVFLKKLEPGVAAPFLSVGIAPVAYRAKGGPWINQPRLEHALGVAVRRDDVLISGSLGWAPFASTRYPLGRENFTDEFFFGNSGSTCGASPVLLHVGVSRFFGTTAPTLRQPKGLEPYVIVGFGGARTIGDVRDFTDQDRSFVRQTPTGVYPEVAAGLQLGRSLSVQVGYRYVRQVQRAFGLEQTWERHSGMAQLLFEVPYGFGNAHPYVGAGAALDHLMFRDQDFGITGTAEGVRVSPVGEMGLVYRPTDLRWLRFRSSLRFTPLAFAYSQERTVSFQHLEFTMLAAEITPRRLN